MNEIEQVERALWIFKEQTAFRSEFAQKDAFVYFLLAELLIVRISTQKTFDRAWKELSNGIKKIEIRW